MRKILTSIEEVAQLLPSWLGHDFAFDVETSGLDYTRDTLLGVALYFDNDSAYYIVLAHTMIDWLNNQYHCTFITPKQLQPYLSLLTSQEDVLMVAHNAKFDMHFLGRSGVPIKGRLADTLLAAQLLDENRKNDLKSLSASVLNVEYDKYQTLQAYKGFKKTEILGVPLPQVADYAMNDVEATWKLYHNFSKKLAEESFRDKSLQDVYNNLWMPLLVVLQEMEAKGIALDIPYVQEMHDRYLEIATEKEKIVRQAGLNMLIERYDPSDIPANYMKVATDEQVSRMFKNSAGWLVIEEEGVLLPVITNEMVNRTPRWRPRIITFNTGSSQQIAELVYEHSGITLPPNMKLKTNTKGYAADADNLQTLLYFNADKTPEFIRALLEWRKAMKFRNTYLKRFLKEADASDFFAIHTNFNQDGTDTGRLSSSGPNLQNIPSRGDVGKEARKMFISRPDHVLLVADLGQAELRMLAHYSQDEALMKAFAENRDLHILTGAGFGRIMYEELEAMVNAGDPRGKELRQLGKTGNFALTYGMGAEKFRRYLLVNNGYEVTISQAQEWIEQYNDTYIGATRWKHGTWSDERNKKVGGVEQFVLANGYIMTYAGRKRRLPWAFEKDRGKKAYAVRQGINAVIQGSVGDIICESMIHIQPALKGIGGSLLLQVHDELVAEVPRENAQLGKAIMEDMMIRFCNPHLRVPQVADCSIGLSWGEAKG